jgi:L-ribulose-5-phosphate 3-epimerase
MPDALKVYQKQIKKLGVLNKKLGIIGNYQNHAGTKVGASFWEINTILATVNTDYFGVQYDIRHAVAESHFSWENGF